MTSLTVPGLRNSSSICYFNSILQALAACQTLLEALQSDIRRVQLPPDSTCTALTQLLQDLQPIPAAHQHSRTAQPLLKTFKDSLPDVLFPWGEEHDAAEALEVLLGCLDGEIAACFHATAQQRLVARSTIKAVMARSRSRADPVLATWRAVHLPCQGIMATEMKCTLCRHDFETQLTPFNVLTLPVPLVRDRAGLLGTASVAPGASLGTCLEAAFAFEMVKGVRCPG